MIKNVASVCMLEEGKVAITAGTSEKLGFVGEGRGICASAIALLKKSHT
jgi:2C-methyl-D-erythritol 2,4-cyclodiphosphate synthase